MEDSSSDLFFALVQFSGDAVKRMDANLSIHGISFTEYRVLHHLSLNPARTLPRIELARSVGLTASGVTRMLAPMEKIGLVRKKSHPRDARMSLVKLSKSGKSIYGDASTTVAHVASSFLDSLSKVQRDSLSRLFSGLK
ncbi:MAG: DNA-binding MarR family transcriptional regulator [Thalassolituus oleivorans]|jgi:DNA-binding MarR family transcriptional regulator